MDVRVGTSPDLSAGLDLDPLARPLPSRTQVLLEWLVAQPLVPPAAGMAIGIVVDAAWAVPTLVAIGLFVASGVAIVRHRRSDLVRHVSVLLAGAAVGAVLHDTWFRRWPANHVVLYCGQEPTAARLGGIVLTTPGLAAPESGPASWMLPTPRTRFFLRAESVEGINGDIPVSGTVGVVVREPALAVAVGDRVELFGTMYRPVPPTNPGESDWALSRRRNGILVEMTCQHAANVLVRDSRASGRRWLGWFRHRVNAAMLERTYPGEVPGSQLLSALVLGQRGAVDGRLNDLFVQSGTVHYLSVSGAHVGMLASVVWMVGMMLGSSPRKCALWALVLISLYAFVIAEARPPVIRSAVMADLFCIAVWLRRPVRWANWLAASLLVILPWQPTAVFNAGFQMSYATLLALFYLSPRVHALGSGLFRRLLRCDDPLLSPEIQAMLNPSSGRTVVHRCVRHVGWLFAIGLSAWSVGTILGAYHFQQVAPWGWLNTVLVTPIVWLTLVGGLCKTVLTACAPALGNALGGPLAAITEALIGVVSLLARLPGSGMRSPAISGWGTAVGIAALTLWVLAPWLRMSERWVGVVALGVLTAAAWGLAPRPAGDALTMHVLSVGRGTTTVIELPNGKTLVCDVGSFPPYDVERCTLSPLLARDRVYRVDAVVISHPNIDHYGGLGGLVEHHRAGCVLAAPHFEASAQPGDAKAKVMTEVREAGVPWRTVVRGDRLAGTGDATIDVLWPPPLSEFRTERSNDTSVVLRLTYAGRRILVCGDIEEMPQSYLLAHDDVKADVLILPHHGAVGPATDDFIKAVDPRYCIRSSNQRDRQTRSGLLELVGGRGYFNTADDGAIEIRITPRELTVAPFCRRARMTPSDAGDGE